MLNPGLSRETLAGLGPRVPFCTQWMDAKQLLHCEISWIYWVAPNMSILSSGFIESWWFCLTACLDETTENTNKGRWGQNLPVHYFDLPAFPAHPSQQHPGDKSISLQNRKTVGWLASLMSSKLHGLCLAPSLCCTLGKAGANGGCCGGQR